MRPAVVILTAGLVLLGAAFARQALPAVDNTASEDDDTGSQVNGDPGGWTDEAASTVDSINPFATMEQSTIVAQAQDANVAAFLDMLKVSEGTAQAGDPYAVCYAYSHTIQDFSDHPKVTGEWPGVPLDKLGADYVGKISTAAGAYQIIKPTWLGCKRALALPDFSPASQDAAAIYMIRQAGALDLVRAGQFDQAVQLCAREWASLPGANAPGQKMRRLDDLRAAYTNAGGSFA